MHWRYGDGQALKFYFTAIAKIVTRAQVIKEVPNSASSRWNLLKIYAVSKIRYHFKGSYDSLITNSIERTPICVIVNTHWNHMLCLGQTYFNQVMKL